MTVNAQLLIGLLKIMDEADNHMVSLWVKGPEDPILVAGHGGSTVGLLMPMREYSLTAEDVLKRGAKKQQ